MPSVPQTVTTRPGTTASANEVTFIPPGYKQTEVGVVPSDWRVSSVGAEFNIQLGKMLDAAKNVGIPKPYIGNRSVQWGRIDSDDIATVPMTVADLQRFRLRRGDLLVCEGGEIGRAAIWEEPIPECYYQKALHRLRTKGRYDAYLMMSLLQLWTSTGYLANYVTQTSIAHLPKDKLEVVPLPVPPPAEQRAIAEALSDVDKLLGSLEEFIAKKRSIKQAAMQQLLTGKTRLPGFSGTWEMKRISDVFSIRVGSSKSKYIVNGGSHLIVDMGAVATDGRLIASKRTDYDRDFLVKGELVMPKDDIGGGKIIGKVAYIDANELYVLGDHVYALRLMGGHPKFFSYLINRHETNSSLRSKVSGSAQLGLARKAVEEQEIPVPTVKEQTAIAGVLSDIDAEIVALEQRRDKTRTIKQGMMQQLLTGRVRLVKSSSTVEALKC